MSFVFIAQEFEIEFTRKYLEWLESNKVGPDPRDDWEFCSGRAWSRPTVTRIPEFDREIKYRWKPAKKRTVTIGGFELVAPEVEAPDYMTIIFVEVGSGKISNWAWEGVDCDQDSLANGKIFLTREDAQAMVDVQRAQRLGGGV